MQAEAPIVLGLRWVVDDLLDSRPIGELGRQSHQVLVPQRRDKGQPKCDKSEDAWTTGPVTSATAQSGPGPTDV